jgi:hypothetical protein
VVHDVAVAVRADVAVEKECLRIFDMDIAILQVNLAFPQGFNLGADERHTGLDGFFYGIVVVSFSVLTNELHE